VRRIRPGFQAEIRRSGNYAGYAEVVDEPMRASPWNRSS